MATETTDLSLRVQTPAGWIELLSPTHSIEWSHPESDDMDPGTLTATILDVALDPATSDTLDSGQPLELRCRDSAGVMRPLVTAKLDTARVTYPRLAPGEKPEKASRIVVTAVDVIKKANGTTEVRSVHTLDGLRRLLATGGIAYRVNGTTAAGPANPTVVAQQEGATLAQQVAITRDTVRGYAWVAHDGVLEVRDAASMPTQPAALYSDQERTPSYTEIEAAYDTTDVLDEVSVEFVRYQPVAGESEVVTYGPYRRAGATGQNSRTVSYVAPTEDAAAIEASARAILARNAVAVTRPLSLSTPVKDGAGRDAALATHRCALVRVEYADKVAANVRVASVEGSIEATKDGVDWTMAYTFEPPDATQQSTRMPVRTPPVLARLQAGEDAQEATTQALEVVTGEVAELSETVVVKPTQPPGSSPAPAVAPFPGGGVYVRFAPVAGATSYRLFVATSNGTAPAAATRLTQDATSPLVVRTLANGDPLPSNPDAPEQPMVYVAVQATNGVSPDPAPSAWVGARPGQVDPAYLQLLVGTLIAERLFGETVEGVDFIGSRFTGGTLRTAEDGQRVQVTSDAVGRVAFYSGSTYETGPGMVTSRVIEDYSTALLDDVQVITEVDSPRITSSGSTWQSFLRLFAFRGRKQNSTDTIQGSSALLQAQTDISLRAPFVLVDGVLGGYLGLLNVDVMGEGSVGDGGFRDSVRQAARSDAVARAAGFRASTTTQSIPSGGAHSVAIAGTPSHSSSRITRSGTVVTVLDAGLYTVTAYTRFDAASGGGRIFQLLVNGAPAVRDQKGGQSGSLTLSLSVDLPLAAGSTLELTVTQSSGNPLALNDISQLNVRRIG